MSDVYIADFKNRANLHSIIVETVAATFIALSNYDGSRSSPKWIIYLRYSDAQK
jgi:hypothetical protein